METASISNRPLESVDDLIKSIPKFKKQTIRCEFIYSPSNENEQDVSLHINLFVKRDHLYVYLKHNGTKEALSPRDIRVFISLINNLLEHKKVKFDICHTAHEADNKIYQTLGFTRDRVSRLVVIDNGLLESEA